MFALCLDDDERFLKGIERVLHEHDVDTVRTTTSVEEAREVAVTGGPTVMFLDYSMPGADGLEVLHEFRQRFPAIEIVMLTGRDDVPTVVAAMRAGAFDFLVKPVEAERLGDVLARLRRLFELKNENADLKESLGRHVAERRLLGQSAALEELRRLVVKAAQSDLTVLITGENGTGKEAVARTLHEASPRHKRPFVPVECSSVSEQLFESELFGHERGAFTGAERRRDGLCLLADDGTLFLDEISEIPGATQAKLLRMLQENEFRPVGANKYLPLKARVVAATNMDLQRAMDERRFREDLYFRLNVLRVQIPALRERKEDIPLLARHFLAEAPGADGQAFAIEKAAMERMMSWHWPGNVRELKNTVARMVALADGTLLREADLPPEMHGRARTIRPASSAAMSPPVEKPASMPPSATGNSGSAAEPAANPAGLTLEQIERQAIETAIQAENGNIQAAAAKLGVSASTIYRKLKTWGVDPATIESAGGM